jgi:hypothetical protein
MCWDNLESKECKEYLKNNNSRCKEGLQKKILKF